MSWYTVDGTAYTVTDIAQQGSWSSPLRASVITRGSAQSEPWDLGDDWPSWHGGPGGLFDDRYSERSVWDPGIEGSIPNGLTQVHSSTQRFVWDPGIGSQLRRANRVAHIFRLLEGKQSWGERSVIFLFLVSPTTGSGWTSGVRSRQVTCTDWCYQRV